MSNYLFPAPEVSSVPVDGETARYPVNRVFCVGRNYAEHAKEMGVEVDREKPFYFLKGAGTIVPSGATVPYPPGSENYHYEMEFVIVIGAPAFRISVKDAHKAIYGYTTGLDMTRRDLQLEARAKGRPWDLGKDFEQSAIIAPITKGAALSNLDARAIKLAVNGETRQNATLGDLVWKVDELVSDLSHYYHLQPGDLIYTGTPAGVGAVVAGDKLVGEIDGLNTIELTIGKAE